MSSQLVWNCRGFAKKASRDRVRDCIRALKLSIVILIETHVNKRRSRNFVRSLGRNWDAFIQAGTGWSGGLLVAWRSDLISATLIHSDDMAMHVFFVDDRGRSWLATLVYASTRTSKRCALWDQINSQEFQVPLA